MKLKEANQRDEFSVGNLIDEPTPLEDCPERVALAFEVSHGFTTKIYQPEKSHYHLPMPASMSVVSPQMQRKVSKIIHPASYQELQAALSTE
jgi:hypothetical protein